MMGVKVMMSLKRSEDCEKDDGEMEETKTVQSQEDKESDNESQRSEDFEKDGDEIEETKTVQGRDSKAAQGKLEKVTTKDERAIRQRG